MRPSLLGRASGYNTGRRSGSTFARPGWFGMPEGWLRRVGRLVVGRPAAGTRPGGEPAPVVLDPGLGPSSHDQIVDRLRLVVVQQSDGTRSPEDVGACDHLFERCHVDSMGGVALLSFIEEHYGVTIDEADLIQRRYSLDALARHILASLPPAQA